MTIGIVDYGVGNLRSVLNAFKAIGASATLCKTHEEMAACDKLVLPGVGAFAEAMKRVPAAALNDLVIAKQRPVLGLCLGMQLLAERSFEHGEHKGLGWLRGDVVRMPAQVVGWNTLNVTRSCLTDGGTFYFVHGYALQATDDVVTARADGVAAIVEQGHIMGAQFHPEKSQRDGLKLLERFVQWA